MTAKGVMVQMSFVERLIFVVQRSTHPNTKIGTLKRTANGRSPAVAPTTIMHLAMSAFTLIHHGEHHVQEVEGAAEDAGLQCGNEIFAWQVSVAISSSRFMS